MKQRFIPYDRNLKEFSRELRNNSTLSEVLLWMKIKNKQIKGYLFLRQKPLDRYIADFYCQKLNLVIEVDGYSHIHPDAFAHNMQRDSVLQKYHLKILRIDDKDVKTDMANVLKMIEAYIDDFETANTESPQPPLIKGD